MSNTLLEFLYIFDSKLHSATHKVEIDSLVSELSVISMQNLNSLSQQNPALYANALSIMQNITSTLSAKIIEFFKQGQLCNINYFHIYTLLWHILPQNSLDSTQRLGELTPFINIAKNALFVPNSDDVENALFIELLILAKMLQANSKDELLKIIKEYICLVSLLDINTPSSLQHSAFITEHFGTLGIDMEVFLESMREVLNGYFSHSQMQRRSIFNWQLHCFWNVPSFYNHKSWLDLYPQWREIFYKLLDSLKQSNYSDTQSLSEAMYIQFFIYHICGNSFESQMQWRDFNNEISRIGASNYEAFAKIQGIFGSFKSSESKSKIRIGILRDRLVNNSPYKVEFSLLKSLLSNEEFSFKYEIRIYTMKLIEKSEDDIAVINFYKSLGVEIIDCVSAFNTQGFYNSHLQKALAIKEALRNDEIDILISPNNGYSISDFIIATRSAKLQIFYSHGNFVYDICGIDSRMTHICSNKLSLSLEGYDFYGVPVKMDTRFYNPPIEQNLISQLRDTFPKNCTILGTIGRLVKLDSQTYWQCVVEIMQKFPTSIYLACGGGNVDSIKQHIKNIAESNADELLKRVYFCGYVDSVIYGHIIDLWLDSFPLEQGESRIEYVAKGGLSIVMSKESEIKRQERLSSFLAESKLDLDANELQKLKNMLFVDSLELNAFSESDYIAKALNLLDSTNEHKDRLRSINAYIRSVFDTHRENIGVYSFINALNTKN